MSKLPIGLTIAGNDPTGGAGILADMKARHSREVYGMAVITSLTAQTTLGVQHVFNVPVDFIDKEHKSVIDDELPHALKTGMIAEADMMTLVAKYIKKYTVPYVMDPVMIAPSGDRLMTDQSMNTLITELIPLADIIKIGRAHV